MRKVTVLFCEITMILGFPWLGSAAELKTEKENVVNGLQCRIETTKTRYIVGGPITFRIKFENVGEKTIHLRGVGVPGSPDALSDAGYFYFNDQRVPLYQRLESFMRMSVSLEPKRSKTFFCTLRPWGWGRKGDLIPKTPGEYKVRFCYTGADILDSNMGRDGFIKSQTLGEVVSNTIEIEIAEQGLPVLGETEIESLKATVEKLRESVRGKWDVLGTIIRGKVTSEQGKRYHFILMHNPRTSAEGRREAAEIVTWSVGGQVVAENDEYFLLSMEQASDAAKGQKELTVRISELLRLEVNNIWKDLERYLKEETRLCARVVGGQMIVSTNPGIILEDMSGLGPDPSIEDFRQIIEKYPEDRDWHGQMQMRIANLLQKKGEWEKAIEIYQKTIDEYGQLVLPVFPGRILVKDRARLEMAACYRQMGNRQEALRILDNLRNQATSRMVRRQAGKEYVELKGQESQSK